MEDDRTVGHGIVLRRTNANDLPTLRRFFTDPGFHQHWGGRPLADDEISEKYLGRRRPSVECFVVEHGTSPVGLAQYHRPDDGGEGGGMDLVLVPEERGRGIGRAVVYALVEIVQQQLGWRRVTVDPDVSNTSGIAFWTKVGFVPVRTVVGEKDRKPYVLMEWPSRTVGVRAGRR